MPILIHFRSTFNTDVRNHNDYLVRAKYAHRIMTEYILTYSNKFYIKMQQTGNSHLMSEYTNSSYILPPFMIQVWTSKNKHMSSSPKGIFFQSNT